jgi:hypothetical protein
MGRHVHSHVDDPQMQRVRLDHLYGPVGERIVRYLRLPTLHPTIRLRLLHAVFERRGGERMTTRRFTYSFWSWRGHWTWGIGFDREGVGLYLGPYSAWLVWRGR